MQGAEDAYKVGTCEELLKWKFAHLNSVDFLLRVNPSGGVYLAALILPSEVVISSLASCQQCCIHNVIASVNFFPRTRNRLDGDQEKPRRWSIQLCHFAR